MKFCPKPVVDFESNLESVKKFYLKKYQSENQEKRVDCLRPRSNKSECECKKCGCDYIYVPNKFFICNIIHFVVYKNGSIINV